MDVDEDIAAAAALGQQLIDAILAHEPRAQVQALVDSGAPLWFQAPDGISALHAAAYAQDAELVGSLLEKGAVWNAVDELQNTAGDVALSLNNEESYELIRDAGLRTEMLLTLLAQKNESVQSPSTLILKSVEATAAGNTDAFLSSKLRFEKDTHGQDVCLVDAGDEEVGVMMGWEREIMQETVRQLCHDHSSAQSGLKILNIGFGLGIIDTLFQNLPTAPSLHVIVEAHPDVLKHMRQTGWMDRPNVRVLEGKWQDFVDEQLLEFGGFDVIYTDTFSEDYLELQRFFEHLPDLLAGPTARFSFFHGLGATNALFYDVYSKLAELHLAQVGLDVAWSEVRVGSGDEEDRWGATRKYFTVPWYRLPVCVMGVME